MAWKCATCAVSNDDKSSVCVCCQTINPDGPLEKDAASAVTVLKMEENLPNNDMQRQEVNNLLQQVSRVKLKDSSRPAAYIWGSGDCDQFSHIRETFELGLPKVMKFDAKDIAVGSLHSALITTTGQLVTWGCNDEGALGHKGQHPKKLKFRASIDKVVCGDTMTCVLLENGDLMVTGCFRDTNGPLGIVIDGSWSDYITEFKRIAKDVLLFSCGTNHIAYLTAEGLCTLGSNEFGQLGLNFNHMEERDKKLKRTLLKAQDVTFRKHKDIVQVCCGAKSTFLILKSGQVYGCGMSGCGELGRAQSTIDTFTLLPPFLGAKQILGGEFHTIVYKSPTEILGCGQRECLGLPNSNVKRTTGATPEQVFVDLEIKHVSVGMGQIFGITKEGIVYCAGRNLSGELTELLPDIVEKPMLMPNDKLFNGGRIEYIAAGSMHSLAFIRSRCLQRERRIVKRPDRLQLDMIKTKAIKKPRKAL